MDEIFIEGLQIETIISQKQLLIVDLNLFYDLKLAGLSDDLAQTLDYAKIALYIQKFADQTRFNLVESFADNLAQSLLSDFKLNQVSLRVGKPCAIKNANNVGVKITRSNLA